MNHNAFAVNNVITTDNAPASVKVSKEQTDYAVKVNLQDMRALGSPSYLFDLDVFARRCEKVKEYLGRLPLTFSMKANPFLLNGIPEVVRHIEVCSPGELTICKKMGVAPDRIIYSGVTKEACDIEAAVSYGVDILTAESILHAQLENEAARKVESGILKAATEDEKPETVNEQAASGILKAATGTRKVLLRLTCGNQFGMSEEDIEYLIRNRADYPYLEFYGIHYYSGTQKKMRQIKKDFQRIEHLLAVLKEKYDYEPKLVEYGPGASVDYFEEPYDEIDWKVFSEIAEEILAFAKKYPVGIEMGRFLASDCGSFLTQIKDSKRNSDTNYLICDGGIHQLRYFGQTMAMQIPPITVIPANETEVSTEKKPYMICGSLCTTADILVREVELPEIKIGDYLLFGRCGAYSVTEGSLLFLSRTMPRIYVTDRTKGIHMVRDFIEASAFNSNGMIL